ncbi:hypothetical protein UlMin_037218, partial [Ulmus minor]
SLTMNNRVNSQENHNWRTEFSRENRKEIVKTLYAEFKSRVNASDRSTLEKCFRVSMEFEEKVFHSMTSKEDYLNNITCQLNQITRLSASSVATENPTINYVEQGGSSSQNKPGRQPVQNQPCQQQTLQNQLPKQIVQQPNNSRSEIIRGHPCKPQQQFVSEPSQYQHIQQAAIKSQPGKQSSDQHLNNSTIVQQNQKFVQQRNASEQKQKPSPINQSDIHGSHLYTPQQHIVSEPVKVGFSNCLNFQQHQNPYQQHGSPKKFFVPFEAMQKGSQFPSLHQAQGLADQRVLPEASTARESTASTETVELANWHHQAYQELQSLRTNCLPNLMSVFEIFKKNSMESKIELPAKQKREMNKIMRMIDFLRSSPSDIAKISKDEFDYRKGIIIHARNTIQNSIAARQQALLLPPSAQPEICSQQQRGNVNVELQAMNLASRSTPDSPSHRSMEHPGTSSSLPNMMNSPQSGSQTEFTCQNTVSSPEKTVFTNAPVVNSVPFHLGKESQQEGVQIKKDQMEIQNTMKDANPGMLQQQHLADQHVASQLSSATCPQSAVDAQTELQSPRAKPIDRLCAVVQSVSPEALLSSAEDIFSVIVTEDVAYATRCFLDAQYLHTSAMQDLTPHVSYALLPPVDETEPIGTSGHKRHKTE